MEKINSNISVASIDDLKTILNLQKKAFGEVAKLMNNNDLPPLLQTIEQIRDESANSIILKYLLEEGRIAGSVRGSLDSENVCHIGKLIVDPDFQNRGIGRALMFEIEQHFPWCTKFVLFTGDETPNTIHLYEKIGYQVIEKKQMGDINMFLMEKENKNKSDFITPPHHINFSAKKLFKNCGEIINGSIAYLQPNGGGPVELHTHPDDHLFIVVKGEAKVVFEDKTHIIFENESFIVKGHLPHSVWNNTSETTVMIGITIKG